MAEIGLVLGVYLLLVGATAWQWLRQPPAVGYYLCGVLGMINAGAILTSRNWLPHDEVSLLRATAYVLALLGQGAIVALVGGRLHRAFTAHLAMIRAGGPQTAVPPEITTAMKGILLASAGGGSVAVIDLILTRRLFFLQSSEIWIFYIVVGATVVITGVAWLMRLLEKGRPS